MSSLFACPCGQRFAVPPSDAAQLVRCPSCTRRLRIPAQALPPPSTSPLIKYAFALTFLIALVLGVIFALPKPKAIDETPSDKPVVERKPIEEPPPPPQKKEEPKKEEPKKEEPKKPPEPPRIENPPLKVAKPPQRIDPETGPRAIALLNAARRAAGVSPLVFDTERSQSLTDKTALLIERPPHDAIADLLANTFERLRLLDPDLERFGMKGKDTTTLLDLPRMARPTLDGAVLCPAEGQKDVSIAFPGNEVPDPIPQSKNKVAGFPITVTFPDKTPIRKATGKLFDDMNREIPSWFSSPEQPANPDYKGHQGESLCLFARDHLRHGTTYTVEMSAEISGKPWSRRWSFTTMSREREMGGIADNVLAQINVARRAAGLYLLELDESLAYACDAHARYIARNVILRPDLDLNDEDEKLPFATKEGKRIARAAHVSAAPFDPTSMVEGWLASFHYRFPLLDSEARKIGIGCAHGARDWYTVVVLADAGPTFAQPLAYPADGQTDVLLEYESGERPDPIPESKDRRAGFPITLRFPEKMRVREVKAELKLDKEDVPFWLTSPEKPVSADHQHNTVCLIARRPFKPDSLYTVKVTATHDGKPFEKSWCFRTRSDGDAEQATMAADALALVNRYRRQAGLSLISLDADLSRGCLLHARYLLTNLDHPSTRGLGLHEEDAKLPGYTKEGKKSGGESVIAAGMPPLASIDDWMATFYHRIPLLDPDLGRIGFGFVRGGPVGWFTVLNATAGKGRESSLIYPGEGQREIPLKGVEEGGYPITITFAKGKVVEQVAATLLASDAREVIVRLLTPERSEAAKEMNTIAILPRDVLRAGTTYTVTINARVDRKPWSRTWTFQTAK